MSQFTADPKRVAQEIMERYDEGDVIYNPASDRQTNFYARSTPLRDINEGEELFDNYLGMSGKNTESWESSVSDLRKICE